MATTTIIIFFLIIRIVDIFIAVAAPNVIPFLGFFPYQEMLFHPWLPRPLTAFASFDGVHYLRIAQSGYENFEQAYFPLYPLLIRLMSYITQDNFVSGFLISFILGTAGTLFFMMLIRPYSTKKQFHFLALIFFLLYPTSFFFGAIYGESLFLFLITTGMLAVANNRYRLGILCAILASATRLAGIFLVFPYLLHSYWRAKQMKQWSLKHIFLYGFLVCSPFIGLALYMGYLWHSTGDPLYFITVQPVYGAYRSTHIILLPQVLFRYMKIFFTASADFRYFIAVFEFITFSIMLAGLILEARELWMKKPAAPHHMRLGLLLFSTAYLLLPTLTGTLSSMPRYSVLSLSSYIGFANIRSRFIRLVLVAVFLLAHTAAVMYFVQGYFIG